MDSKKLKKLREKYLDSGSQVFDPKFKKVADYQFNPEGVRFLPFGGIPTLLDAPQSNKLEDLDIALIGVPMDLGTTNRSGARFGPRAVRGIERVGPYNHNLDVLPFKNKKCADIGDVPFRSRFKLDSCIEDIEKFYHKVVDAGVIPLTVGGDHSITHPILKAVGRNEAVACIHIDAHCDTSGEYEGTRFQHGAPFRNAVLDGVLDPEKTIQIGIRGNSEFLWEFSYESGMTVIHVEKFAEMGVQAVIEATIKLVGNSPVYVSLDVDGIDPSFAPGTGTPEVGGLTPREVQILLRGCSDLNVIGGDVVEIAPQYDATTNTVHVGAQMLFEILSMIAKD